MTLGMITVVLSARSTVSAVHSEWGTTVVAFTVIEPLGPGDQLTDHLQPTSLPSVLLPSDALAERPGSDERSSRSLAPGDIVTERDLASTRRPVPLDEGKRALSLPTSQAMPLLYVGDLIELVIVEDVLLGPGVADQAESVPGVVIAADETTITLSVAHQSVVAVVAAIADDRVVVVRR